MHNSKYNEKINAEMNTLHWNFVFQSVTSSVLFLTDTNRGKTKLVFQNGNNLYKVFTQVFSTPV